MIETAPTTAAGAFVLWLALKKALREKLAGHGCPGSPRARGIPVNGGSDWTRKYREPTCAWHPAHLHRCHEAFHAILLPRKTPCTSRKPGIPLKNLEFRLYHAMPRDWLSEVFSSFHQCLGPGAAPRIWQTIFARSSQVGCTMANVRIGKAGIPRGKTPVQFHQSPNTARRTYRKGGLIACDARLSIQVPA